METIDSIAIVGAGVMGRRIGFACAFAGQSVKLFDVDPKQTEAALLQIERWAKDRSIAFVCRPEAVSTLSECVREADLIIENVPERLDLKRSVFEEIDAASKSTAILASNTSSIPGSWLADSTNRPNLLINVNFGHVDDRKVEVMPHPGTATETIEKMTHFLESMGMIAILVLREQIGYSSNRIWRVVKKEVLRQLDEGISTPEEIDRAWMLDWDTSIGPCGLMDRVGLDVVRDIENIYFEASGDPSDRPPGMLEKMIVAGRVGEKADRGFYRYPDPAYQRVDFLERKKQDENE